MFNRYMAKMQARASMRQNKPSPLLVTLVYLALSVLLARVVGWFLLDPAALVTQYYAMGYAIEEILAFVLSAYTRELILFGAVEFLLSIYNTVMDFGYTSYALRLARNENPGLTHIFDGFLTLGRVLLVNILKALFLALWCLVPFLAMVGVGVASAMYDFVLLDAAYLAAAACLVAVMYIVYYRYRMAYYFLLDDPACTARQSITRSKQAMKGWKMELFALDLSFLGWQFLAALTMNILSVWVTPYYKATEANFYDGITGTAPASDAREPLVF